MKAKLDWFLYWHIKRRSHYAFISLIWRLPRKVVYWCVVRAACEAEPHEYPGEKTAVEMMKAMEAKQ